MITIIMVGNAGTNKKPVEVYKPKPRFIPAYKDLVRLRDEIKALEEYTDTMYKVADKKGRACSTSMPAMGRAYRLKIILDKLYLRWRKS